MRGAISVCAAVAALASVTAAHAEEDMTPAQMMTKLNGMQTAREAGQIIATAEICGYELDAGKVSAFMTEILAEMDQTARMSFQSAGGAHKLRMGEMSEIERTAACALQAKLAKKMRLMD